MPVAIRAITGRFSAPFSRQALERVIAKHPFVFCADIYGGDVYAPLKGVPASHQEYFQSSEVRNAHYANADWSALAPLDEELIEKMRECEAVFMSIVTRLEAKASIPYLTRKLWYLRHLQFWNDYITRNRINVYISAWIPHEIPDIVVYYLCKARGIPVLYFDITVFRDTSVAGHDVRFAADRVGKTYVALEKSVPKKEWGTLPLGEPFASYEKALVSPAGKPPAFESVRMPTYGDHLRRMLIHKPIAAIRHAAQYGTPTGWLRAGQAIRRRRSVRSVDAFYAAHTTRPDLRKSFVYMPLHYQPEAATVPMGGAYADQILMARLLNAHLPEGTLIYVKEHPHRSSWSSRSIEYYKDFLELSKVRLIPTRFDTFKLREHCAAVATITGSAGFEALFRGKPVFLFGSCYYQYARGVFPIRSAKDCADGVRAVFEKKEKPTPESTHVYLKAMEEACVPGVPDPWYLKISKKTEAEHTQAMSEAICRELEEMKTEIAAV